MRWLLLISALVVTTGVEARNFSQYPGFAELLSRRPPATAPANPAERELLQRHAPRVFLPEGHAGAIDFYADYIAHGRLRTGGGRDVPGPITRRILNEHRDDPDAVFVHDPPTTPSKGAVVYGHVDRFTLGAGATAKRFTLLGYHLVFRHSGLPAGVDGLTARLLSKVGDLDDWHQLDHYTAAWVVLDDTDTPRAVVLQQHNYVRTYILGEAIEIPADGRVELDVAIRSNELYPHRDGRRRRRAVPFADAAGLRYLMGEGTAPLLSADDITHPHRELDYRLDFLPLDDAFYLFQGYLGARRDLPGRDGPPGAWFNTEPRLKPWAIQLTVGYWRVGDGCDRVRAQRLVDREDDPVAFAEAQRKVFLRRLGPPPWDDGGVC